MKKMLLTIGLAIIAIVGAIAQVPTNVQATQGDTTSITVTWDAVPDATGYEITAEAWDVAGLSPSVYANSSTEMTCLSRVLPATP